MSEFDGRRRHPIDHMVIPVMGGRFEIKELLVDKAQGVKGILDRIRTIPPDRWFVMLAENEGTTEDVLALINDRFEFESIAIGTLNSESE